MNQKYSKHQQKIIKNYYDNKESISLQRLSELVSKFHTAMLVTRTDSAGLRARPLSIASSGAAVIVRLR